jgi:hypothetical protein
MSKSTNKLSCLILFTYYLLFGTSMCRADLILFNYKGDSLAFAEGPFLSSTDSISGIIGFDAIGSQFARSVSLAVLDSLGNERFRMEIPDTSQNTTITIATNTFNWQSQSLPKEFELTMFANVFGGIGSEQISIGDFGDLALVDIGLPTESSAYNFQAGTFSAVPEPSSLALCLGASLLILFFRNVSVQGPASLGRSPSGGGGEGSVLPL